MFSLCFSADNRDPGKARLRRKDRGRGWDSPKLSKTPNRQSLNHNRRTGNGWQLCNVFTSSVRLPFRARAYMHLPIEPIYRPLHLPPSVPGANEPLCLSLYGHTECPPLTVQARPSGPQCGILNRRETEGTRQSRYQDAGGS